MKIILILVLLLLPMKAMGTVNSEISHNNSGVMFLRLYNSGVQPYHCQIEDDVNFHSFVIYPGATSRWYPVYGYYTWNCA